MHISYSICSKLKTLVGVAFTGVEWERLCQDVMFSATKVLIISSNERGDLFVGKVIDGLVPEPVKKFNSARGESSNAGACSEKSFIAEFIGRSLYMSSKIHIDKRVKTDKNTNVQLVGEMHRLKEVLENDSSKVLLKLESTVDTGVSVQNGWASTKFAYGQVYAGIGSGFFLSWISAD
ncbi:hypothetical protein Tco_1022028 [Tanacetum coccineum]